MKLQTNRHRSSLTPGYSWLRMIIACLLPWLAAADLQAGGRQELFASEAGEGPLLFFVRPENSHGKPLADDEGDRRESVYVWSAGDPGPPQRVMRCDVPLPNFLHRISQQGVLIRYHDRLQLLDLKAGKMERLLKTDDQSDLVRADGTTLYVLQQTVPRESSGYRLKTQDGKTVLDEWHRPKDRLCAYFAGDVPKTVELAEPLIEAVLQHDAEGFWVVTAETPPRLLHVSTQGVITDALPWQADWAVCEAKFSLSPDARHMALSILRTDQDFHERRDLVVMSREKKAILQTVRDIDLRNSLLSGSTPSLQLAWLDRSTLRFGSYFFSSWQVLNVETLAITKFDPTAVLQREPSDPRIVVGKFETTHGRVWFGKDTELAGSVLNAKGNWVSSCLEFSPDSAWAALASPELDSVVVLDGENRTRRKLIDGWCYDLRWLGAPGEKP
ncbi:MAG: hypothetical protein NTY98_27665 [Verrucomicrobia bacterium]|nr:hypothetical protein [Verrucomicrobiota bacterium]